MLPLCVTAKPRAAGPDPVGRGKRELALGTFQEASLPLADVSLRPFPRRAPVSSTAPSRELANLGVILGTPKLAAEVRSCVDLVLSLRS